MTKPAFCSRVRLRRPAWALAAMPVLPLGTTVSTPPDPMPAGSIEIVVTTAFDATNGDVSSGSALVADPGPDGISLREAIQAANGDATVSAIRFDRGVDGDTIEVSQGGPLPELTGGGLTIDGDVDGDASPDVTIAPANGLRPEWGLSVASSGNRLRALRIAGFRTGVQLTSSSGGGNLPIGQTYAGNEVIGLTILGASDGIAILSGFSRSCSGPPRPDRCETENTWRDTTIRGNTIEVSRVGDDDDPRGIRAIMSHGGDRFQDAAITDNRIIVEGERTDAGIGLETSGDSTNARIVDVLIAGNSIEGSAGLGVVVAAGTQRAQHTTIRGIRILENRLRLSSEGSGCCQGIVLSAGSDAPYFAEGPPVRYLDANTLRDVVVAANTVTGDLEFGISVQAGIGGGGQQNRVTGIKIIKNVFRTTRPGIGAFVWTGDGTPYADRYSEHNVISSLDIEENEFVIARGVGAQHAGGGVGSGGIVLMGGHEFGRENLIEDVAIERNRIEAALWGIGVFGGVGPRAERNRVIDVRGADNRITGTDQPVTVISDRYAASENLAAEPEGPIVSDAGAASTLTPKPDRGLGWWTAGWGAASVATLLAGGWMLRRTMARRASER